MLTKSNVIRKIKDILELKEFEMYKNKVYICGGAVRDHVMNPKIISKDIDLVVDIDNGGILFADLLCKHLNIYKENSNPVIYNRFKTCKFIIDNEDLEAVCPRKEEYDEASRNPKVKYCTLKEDALRRDFTINALYYNISTGEIIDFSDGINDINNKLLQTPLNPVETFNDDPLRMLRAFRFFARFNEFELSNDIINAIYECHDRLSIISRERIMGEMIKILSVNDSIKLAYVLNIMMESGILNIIFDGIGELYNLKQGISHTYRTVWEHTLNAIRLSPCDYKIRLSLLLHDIGKSKTCEYYTEDKIMFPEHDIKGAVIAESLLKQNKFCNDDIDEIKTAVCMHMTLSNFYFKYFILNKSSFENENKYFEGIKECKDIIKKCGKYLNTCLNVFCCDVKSLDLDKRKIKDHHLDEILSEIDKLLSVDTYLCNNKKYLIGYDIMNKYPNINKSEIKNYMKYENDIIFVNQYINS